MKITAISIFPEYFSPLELSLIGKARSQSLIEFKSINLRDFTTDNHHSVDDTPYGGGAGMVMMAEPWGQAIDSILEKDGEIDLIILTPAGAKFNQRKAEQLSKGKHLVFACGRYEGIDARVGDYYREGKNLRVHEISIGDYVVNGGEVAALVIIEAVTRLVPGVIGNPESLDEESHNEIGALEYPTFTKPAIWRNLNVPEVLLSGNHGQIQKWRQEEAKRRSELGQ
ncbi:MAG: tRNA (guanosine(37)-N1)-methyltransferase TrmD [Actinobacteria bacterium]|nr:tRNA (guanosine(37)-N1)-methyltransferase TrmD [Actinomycetota bacterium]NBO47279.1 tRNA (guanosine(37)-N1)-methyltransferase TrmD [Actinomycetota bacterium]NBP22162.1 tRNA (guanosine(37)-N1)-methyltransferase TrmD [Actinomycetota bacterium]NBP42815.1 tRNA (guanosine(37)-N1)-methyltransferase TrmD [Actinomycetota bacterium]NBQ00709.1 tRNA (guanosine(37)-N1)-methyltransferase TrmD [Actinomycetota bacterium]